MNIKDVTEIIEGLLAEDGDTPDMLAVFTGHSWPAPTIELAIRRYGDYKRMIGFDAGWDAVAGDLQ